MSKLSFRARALDASKPMPIYMAEELPDLPDYSAINRAVPQMPSGMEKEEECEHHLQRAICTGLIIPTPEVTDLADAEIYNKIYPADYKLPRQLIHMQPFAMEQDIPDYDMDSEDEKWVALQSRKMELTPLQFEEMMDRLEKSSGQTVVTLNEAKALLKEDDDLIIAVFDYWLNKRLKTQHPLLLTVKTENRFGSAANNPYFAFRRRTEKMQTRKNRKNDETSYEKMLKLRRDLSRAVTLLEMVKRREKTKREHLHLTIEIYEKRYQAQDFSGQILSEVSALKAPRPAFAPLFTNQFGVHQNWTNKVCKDEVVPRKEKRQYKKRKHKTDSRGGSLDDTGIRSGTGSGGGRGNRPGVLGSGLDPLISSDEDSPLPHSHSQPSLPSDRDDEDATDEGQFAFRRNRNSSYLPPVSGGFGNWPWCDKNEGGIADKKYRFALTSISKPVPRCIGFARRRIGRGGRVILDRCSADMDDMWSTLDFTIHDSNRETTDSNATATAMTTVKQEWLHFRPKTPPVSVHSPSEESTDDTDSDVEPTVSRSKLPYPFPPDATSICIEVEPERAGDESPFTSEFNIADYFVMDTMSDTDLAETGLANTSSACISGLSDSSVNESRTDGELGSSHFVVTPLVNNLFAPLTMTQHTRLIQCSGGSSVVHTSTSSSLIPTLSSVVACTTNQAIVASSTMSTQCTVGVSAAVDTQSNHQSKQQHRQLPNNSAAASILSKSLTSPTNNRNGSSCGGGGGGGSGSSSANVRVFSASTTYSGSSGGSSSSSSGNGSNVTNFGNSHQNGPLPHINNSNNLTNSTHVVNNQQSTLVMPQKHPPSNLLPGLITQSKLATLARKQQQQTQNQAPQVPTSGEITLNSNSENLDMEVDGVDSSPCDSKPQQQQQQQLVRANKTNSLAMEVT
ncbi:PREDICTED: enhancer of polycomb homolog 1 [Cyphomyrmex costatus]|uniref:Enhancer of polycomb-like protein n=1 Tax=Cyphomyrmex costatus TaxID=456900 RepID=A0A151IJ77_9HYME|nr:PREDICTED: enhancer of polycomb homolog 1 [Cyphomyrmex costatus]KYN02573.1 Enhancer of polycomb like protein 1 [Cyphomyrmex costatus]